MHFKLHTNGDLELVIPHSEVDVQISLLQNIECQDTQGQKDIDDLLNVLQLMRAGMPYRFH